MEEEPIYTAKKILSRDNSERDLSRTAVLHQVLSFLKEEDAGRTREALPKLQDLLSEYSKRNESVHDSGGKQAEAKYPQPLLLTEQSNRKLIDILKREISSARTVYLTSAFCSSGIINLLLTPLEELARRDGRIHLLTSFMHHHNNPRDLLHLQKQIPSGEIRIYDPEGSLRDDAADPPDFHVKAYLFEKEKGDSSLIIGSSNLTLSGMVKNVEWNYFSNSEITFPFTDTTIFDEAKRQFLDYWEKQSFPLDKEFSERYYPVWKAHHSVKQRDPSFDRVSRKQNPPLTPRESQQEALNNLSRLREMGIRKAAVIAATGLGKTYLSAFDAKIAGARRVLFIAHRENILIQAQQAYEHVFGPAFNGIVVSGNAGTDLETPDRDLSGISFFATIQFLSRDRNLRELDPDSFDYVVVDEFHHAAADSYTKILEYFKPDFLLGMTATPERMDGREVLELCDYNIAYEARLFDSIDRGWLSPFQYFAVYDPTDYQQIRWTGRGYEEADLEEHLSTDTRAELVISNLRKYLPSSGKIKALAFCANIGHARYMTDAFTVRGIPAACVVGTTPPDEREALMNDLADETHPLQVICSVDVFNEGIDIPQVSHVLLLRPTESYSLLLQQIGRGLRKIDGKEFVVVLDFVGNYRNSFIMPTLLSGALRVTELARDTSFTEFSLPGLCTVESDTDVVRIWQDEIRRIFKQIARKDLSALYKENYLKTREAVGHSLQSLDMFIDEELTDFDTHDCIRKFGSWLRFKESVNDLTKYEKTIPGTPGEYLLAHIEKALRPNKTYKMAVLSYLIGSGDDSTEWDVDAIAKGFHDFYLNNPVFIEDYPDLQRAENPAEYSRGKIRQHVLKNPLHFLSNTEADCFILDKKQNRFLLKEAYRPYWKNSEYRKLLRDRITYVLKKYQRERMARAL